MRSAWATWDYLKNWKTETIDGRLESNPGAVHLLDMCSISSISSLFYYFPFETDPPKLLRQALNWYIAQTDLGLETIQSQLSKYPTWLIVKIFFWMSCYYSLAMLKSLKLLLLFNSVGAGETSQRLKEHTYCSYKLNMNSNSVPSTTSGSYIKLFTIFSSKSSPKGPNASGLHTYSHTGTCSPDTHTYTVKNKIRARDMAQPCGACVLFLQRICSVQIPALRLGGSELLINPAPGLYRHTSTHTHTYN